MLIREKMENLMPNVCSQAPAADSRRASRMRRRRLQVMQTARMTQTARTTPAPSVLAERAAQLCARRPAFFRADVADRADLSDLSGCRREFHKIACSFRRNDCKIPIRRAISVGRRHRHGRTNRTNVGPKPGQNLNHGAVPSPSHGGWRASRLRLRRV